MHKRLQSIENFKHKIDVVLTDIDDTLTSNGKLSAESFKALWDLKSAKISVIPVTGRPAGWCEMIARQWPVDGVIGENGAFYFKYDGKKMHRFFHQSQKVRLNNSMKLKKLSLKILKTVPGCEIASDQFCRISDLAIDFCEDVKPLSKTKIDHIVKIFEQNKAVAKISSIHVNGWFGHFDKLTTALKFLSKELKLDEKSILQKCAFVGDSPNDEPMFKFFKHTFGVANLKNYKSEMTFLPTYLSEKEGGLGFAEISGKLIKNLKK